MAEVVYVTKERVKEIEEEVHLLKFKGRREIAQKIADARSHGDLSENAEYEAAKHDQELLEIKIHKLETILGKVQVISPDELPNDKVYILTKVKLKNLKNNSKVDYILVSPEEADFEKGKLSVTSPIGKALMGKKIGDIAEISAPVGKMQFEILDISK
ncbi:MAG: transcription elongation factor GreA [Bacteroidota bacterium]